MRNFKSALTPFGRLRRTWSTRTAPNCRLTEKEAAILRYLHRAEQQPVARETLLKHVWGYNANVTTHTLETHIYRLRQKIEHNPAEAQLLVTEGGGYKLVASGAAGGRPE